MFGNVLCVIRAVLRPPSLRPNRQIIRTRSILCFNMYTYHSLAYLYIILPNNPHLQGFLHILTYD
jgi:hypothetical protein